MRIAVLGATGMAGAAVVDEALARGHTVLALSRTAREDPRAGVTSRPVDVSDADGLRGILDAVDTAVWAVRPDAGREGEASRWIGGLLDSARDAGIPVVVVGGSAPLRSPGRAGRLVLDDPELVPEEWRAIAAASLAQFETCAAHLHRRWTYISPSAVFEPGPASRRHLRGTDTLLRASDGSSRTTSGDMARAVLDEIETPTGDRHLTVLSPREGDGATGGA